MIIQKIRLMLDFSKIIKMLVAFIVGAILIGRPDLPMKAILYLQAEAVKLNECEVELASSLQSKKGEYAESFMVTDDKKAVIRVFPSKMEYKIANSEANSS